MKALSVRPPWSWAIAWAGKDVENRTWPAPHNGLIAIHASLRPERNVIFPVPRAIRAHLNAQRDQDRRIEVRGAIVAVAEIAGCHAGLGMRWPCEGGELCSPWAVPGQYHWQLRRIRPLADPVPCKGALGLWTVPEEIEAAVRAQSARNSQEAGNG